MGLTHHPFEFDDMNKAVSVPTPRRIFALGEAIKKGYSVEKLYKMTGVDPWFLGKIKNIVRLAGATPASRLRDIDLVFMRELKQTGFSDVQIAHLVGSKELEVRAYRKKLGVIPVVKQIDTLAAEFPAQTNYLYMTYWGDRDDVEFSPKKARSINRAFGEKTIVIGSGPYCIGSSVEFDWCCVNTVKTLRKKGS